MRFCAVSFLPGTQECLHPTLNNLPFLAGLLGEQEQRADLSPAFFTAT